MRSYAQDGVPEARSPGPPPWTEWRQAVEAWMWPAGTLTVILLLFVAFCMRQRLHKHKFDRTLDAMNKARRFRDAKAANDFSVGLERAFKAVGEDPKFTPPHLAAGVGELLRRRKDPPQPGLS